MNPFFKLESSSGALLCAMAVLALAIDNTPWHTYYDAFFHLKSVSLTINDGLMSIFFLLVGLEIKRELLTGELNSWSKALLPAIAALGGMIVPGLFYVTCNYHNPHMLVGWAIPTATDIAFSLAVLSLLGSRVPVSLKIFLTALAIFDDLGAIIIIAVFYTHHIVWWALGIAFLLLGVLVILNRLRVFLVAPYVVIGVVLWGLVFKSGIHPTLAGIAVACAIPLKRSKQVEKAIHPWVAFGVLPLFALANAGVSFLGLNTAHLLSALPLGIAGGLFIGKQVGIWGSSMLAIRLKIAELPAGSNVAGLYAIALVAGVGFTMSLFIGSLAFGGANADVSACVRLGVLSGSLLSSVVGYLLLRMLYRG